MPAGDEANPHNMPIDSSVIKAVTASLYERSLKGIPRDTRAFLGQAHRDESDATARRTFAIMLDSADLAASSGRLVCSSRFGRRRPKNSATNAVLKTNRPHMISITGSWLPAHFAEASRQAKQAVIITTNRMPR